MKKSLSGIIIVCYLLLFSFVGITMSEELPTVEVTASWSPPTTGSPVEYYVLQLKEGDIPFITHATTPDTTIVLELKIMTVYVARVAGVDALGRQGPWSDECDPYTPDIGVPGTPGRPTLIIH